MVAVDFLLPWTSAIFHTSQQSFSLLLYPTFLRYSVEYLLNIMGCGQYRFSSHKASCVVSLGTVIVVGIRFTSDVLVSLYIILLGSIKYYYKAQEVSKNIEVTHSAVDRNIQQHN